MSRRICLVVMVLVAALVLPAGPSAPAEAPVPGAVTSRVSVGTGGVQGSGGGPAMFSAPALSGDGQVVAFSSDATNLVQGDTNGVDDVFVHDRTSGVTTRVSVRSDGGDASGPSLSPAISADGKVVAFASAAPDLVLGDTNEAFDIFVHDRTTGDTTRVSVPTFGTQAAGASDQPALSGDGSLVVFASDAPDMVNDDRNGTADVFLHNRKTKATTRMSVDFQGGDADGASDAPDISDGGTVVTFDSDATDLILNDGNGVTDVFVRDPQAATTSRVNVGAPEAAGGASFTPSLSGNGRYVAFASGATNLVTPDTNDVADVFVYDRQMDRMTRVSVAATAGSEPDGSSLQPDIDASGRFVTFSSDATNLVVNDTNGATDVFRRDLGGIGTTTTRESVGQGGAQASGLSHLPRISDGGGVVVFASAAPDLMPPPPTGNFTDVYVREAGSTARVSVPTGGAPAHGRFGSSSPALGVGGRLVAFASSSEDLVPGDTNRASDVFVHDRETNTTNRVSVPTGGGQADGASSDPAMSADGRYVAFTSEARNLVEGDTNDTADVFLHDRETDRTIRVSLPGGSGQFDVASGEPAISADGRYVAFVSGASTPDPDAPPSGMTDVYVRNHGLGLTLKVSVAPGSAPADGPSRVPALSADGQTVAFASQAANLVPGDKNGVTDIFVARFSVKQEATGTAVSLPAVEARVSVATGGAEPTGPSEDPSISADGQTVAFASVAPNLVEGDTNDGSDVFVHDRRAKATTRVSVGPQGAQVTGRSTNPALSADGLTVAFSSDAPDLVPGDEPGLLEVFLHDRLLGATDRASVRSTGGQGDAPSVEPAVSLDGRVVAFASHASDLVPGDTNGVIDVFVRDRRPAAGRGYWLVASDGGVFAYGQAAFLGSTGDISLNRPIVAIAPTPSGAGYWFVASDGGVFAFGDAPFAGSLGGQELNAPIVGMASTPTGRGYWLVASDGGIFAFGDARFSGSTGGKRLNRPIVGMAATPTGLGYWLVSSDGGIFAFGDARFFGSTGGTRLNRPIVGMAATPTGLGYWLVASDGGIFTFGDARFAGSTGGMPLNRPIVGMAITPSGLGYWLVASDGGIFTFGDARFAGSAGGTPLNAPVIGLAGS